MGITNTFTTKSAFLDEKQWNIWLNDWINQSLSVLQNIWIAKTVEIQTPFHFLMSITTTNFHQNLSQESFDESSIKNTRKIISIPIHVREKRAYCGIFFSSTSA